MIAHKWNGEYWYEEKRSIVGHALNWLIWIGGWQAHRRLKLRLLTPISLFGHRITIYSGRWVDWRRPKGTWVFSRTGIYRSPDGSPSSATIWLRGTPNHILHAGSPTQPQTKPHRPLTRGRDDES